MEASDLWNGSEAPKRRTRGSKTTLCRDTRRRTGTHMSAHTESSCGNRENQPQPGEECPVHAGKAPPWRRVDRVPELLTDTGHAIQETITPWSGQKAC